jgi:16S rRNA (guanine966-N2)-methyltransferase
MRVIAGEARGRALRAPAGTRTRPTADRVRGAVFNMLGSQLDLDGAVVLDLFAGSGALGIEALSRGAAAADFVDNDGAARRAVAGNLAATGLGDRGRVRPGDATSERLLADLAAAVPDGYYDVAFCDPPYAFDGWDGLLAALPARWLVVESDREVPLPSPWEVVRTKRYGSTVVVLARRDVPGGWRAEQE